MTSQPCSQSIHSGVAIWWNKGRAAIPKRMNFWKSSKRPLPPPPPHFRKIILRFFYNGYRAFKSCRNHYASRYEGQIVCNTCTWYIHWSWSCPLEWWQSGKDDISKTDEFLEKDGFPQLLLCVPTGPIVKRFTAVSAHCPLPCASKQDH